MSIINKKPFIKTLIESLSDSDLTTLRSMIDGGGSQTVLLRTTSTTFTDSERSRITTSDKGVHRCSLEVQGGLYTWNGYLIYNNTYCVLIYYTNNFQTLGWLKVKSDFKEIEYIGEELSIIELRSELDDTAKSESAEIISVVNDGIADGSIDVKSFKPFSSSWPTTGTTKAFCDAINADSSVTIGNAYLGGASFSDLPFVGNGDIVVEILEGPSNSKSIHLILTSGNVAPYHWEYTYWNSGDNLSGWIGYQTKITANPTLEGTENDLEGVEIDSTKYVIPPRVSANPELEGTESELTGLKIGNTKYKASSGGGGSHCYYLKVLMQALMFPNAYYAFNYYTNAVLTTLSDFYADLIAKYPNGYPISSRGSSTSAGGTKYAHLIYPESVTDKISVRDILSIANSDSSISNTYETAFVLSQNTATMTKIY